MSFWPNETFAAHGQELRLVFGEANAPVDAAAPSTAAMLGMAWLHALHARSSLARGRLWQVLYTVNGVREHVVQLACVRHALPFSQGRGVDDLPKPLVEALTPAVPQTVEHASLVRAFEHTIHLLLAEAMELDPVAGVRLRAPLFELVRTSDAAAR
ncbi:MAG: hypothetical protein ACJ735_06595 [Actinomycetes bacterium]